MFLNENKNRQTLFSSLKAILIKFEYKIRHKTSKFCVLLREQYILQPYGFVNNNLQRR